MKYEYTYQWFSPNCNPHQYDIIGAFLKSGWEPVRETTTHSDFGWVLLVLRREINLDAEESV